MVGAIPQLRRCFSLMFTILVNKIPFSQSIPERSASSEFGSIPIPTITKSDLKVFCSVIMFETEFTLKAFYLCIHRRYQPPRFV